MARTSRSRATRRSAGRARARPAGSRNTDRSKLGQSSVREIEGHLGRVAQRQIERENILHDEATAPDRGANGGVVAAPDGRQPVGPAGRVGAERPFDVRGAIPNARAREVPPVGLGMRSRRRSGSSAGSARSWHCCGRTSVWSPGSLISRVWSRRRNRGANPPPLPWSSPPKGSR